MAALVSGQWRTTFSDHVDDDGGDGFIGVVLDDDQGRDPVQYHVPARSCSLLPRIYYILSI